MRRLVILLTLMGSLISCSDTSHDPASNATTDAMTASLSGSPSALIWQGQCAACLAPSVKVTGALVHPAHQLSADYIARQLKHFISGVRGAETGDKAGKRMAGVANLSEVDISKLAQLITTELPPTESTATLRGDAARGEDYYINICSACHGGNGQGNDALGAPALAGVNDWYLKSSYESYLEGLRGTHTNDFYGLQMARLAPALANSDDINDVVAFIATLPPQRSP